jgi:hypothetical protein
MSTQADYTPEEWNILVHAPAQASMLVVNADKSGGFKGQFAIIQETKDARTAVQTAADTGTVDLVKKTAQSLLEETSWRPMIEGATAEKVTKYLQQASSIVQSKATPVEATAYRKYVYDVATKTASAVAETSGGPQTSDREKVALQQIANMINLNG